MKRYLTRAIFKTLVVLASAAGMTHIVSAQEYENTPVSISKEKIRIDGTVCYSHIVLERQTLFSISKAYNVSIEDIYKFNPSVKEKGLQKNSIILIPCEGMPASLPKTIQEDKKPVLKETKPEVTVSDDNNEAVQKTHIVKWYEDLDVIAEKYGVSVDAIMKANGLKGRKLTKRQKLIIPISGSGIVIQEETQEETPSIDTTEVDVQKEDKTPEWLFPKKNDVSVSLLMPLKATGSTSSRNNMDFYAGVLLAAYDLGKEGIKTELSVFDVADGNMPVTRERIEASDIVIGPISSGDITRLMELAPDAKAVISPLDPRAEGLVSSYDNLIQAPVPHKLQYEDLASWLKEDLKNSDRVVVITEKGAKATNAVSLMKAAIDSSGISYSPFSYSILEGRSITTPLTRLMTENGTNRVMIASESEAFVNDVVRNLNVLIHKKYDIVLYAPSKIRSFETIEVENFHNTSMHVSLGYYIDYSDKRVMDFLMKYRALYNTEPTQFAFQGYDIASYFIRMCSKYGNRWMSRLEESDMQMLQSTFRCIRDGENGYMNNGVRRIIYSDDWSIVKVK